MQLLVQRRLGSEHLDPQIKTPPSQWITQSCVVTSPLPLPLPRSIFETAAWKMTSVKLPFKRNPDNTRQASKMAFRPSPMMLARQSSPNCAKMDVRESFESTAVGRRCKRERSAKSVHYFPCFNHIDHLPKPPPVPSKMEQQSPLRPISPKR